ncbi:MAG: hypothetical protein WBC73_04660 [Phormidesmis sp.]
MTLHELQQQALKLPCEDRQQLVTVLMRSLQPQSFQAQSPQLQSQAATIKQKGLAASLVGLAKTDAPAPSDEEVRNMLDEHLVQKYL